MGQVTSKGNEAKSKMKQPSDIPTILWSNTLPLDHGGAPKCCHDIYQLNMMGKYTWAIEYVIH